MNLSWIAIELIATTFENFLILDMIDKMFGCKFEGYKKVTTFYITLFLIVSCVTVLNNSNTFTGFYTFIPFLIVLIYSLLCNKSKTPLKFLIPILALAFILIINISVTYLLSLIFGIRESFIFSSFDAIRLFCLCLTKFLFFVLTRLIISFYRKEKINLKSDEIIVMSVVFVTSLITAISLVQLQLTDENKEVLIFISIFGVFTTFFFVVLILSKISAKNETQLKIALLELQLSEQKSMIEDAGNISKEIKKAEHDLKHHLMSVLGSINSGDTVLAQKYVETLLHEYESNIFKYIQIENSAINSVLNFKISRCRSENIDIKVEIESCFDAFNEVDICVLLANLLDNAIEASEKVEKPTIKLAIKQEKNYLSILIENKISKSVLAKNNKLKTTKRNKQKHGFGMFSISQIVEKYDGVQSFYEEDDFFIVDIWLKSNSIVLKNDVGNEV